ncbi:unnamed protein product [Meloidogyne enterolobii]|uniref:Uncharacterized protein n=1 Tax=Meloidogyne enterolobii TaxID=390850 RepID=A0ACB0Y7E9_MELEN
MCTSSSNFKYSSKNFNNFSKDHSGSILFLLNISVSIFLGIFDSTSKISCWCSVFSPINFN